MLGAISLSSSSRFPVSSGFIWDSPVILPPGRAKLATIPVATGSPAAAITIGIPLAAFFAARVSLVTAVTIMSTLSRTRSAMSPGRRSFLPSANRYSMAIFFPSTHPSSRSPRRKAWCQSAVSAGEKGERSPIREIFAACWARVASGHATESLSQQRTLMKSRPSSVALPRASGLRLVQGLKP